ncbi:preprotein translocase subunit YajC [Granulicoccus phenolivorans]|uniref:preprotein translocase subunit YajC n=1 Tax=Granulicoccus phenolivorans TaxID=266854 RepID=UPI000415FCA7|nr:preprotein translocase subunit YajC [Granulicoccus phenolivorans]
MDAFTIVLIVAMVAIFYFMVLRPNKKRQEQQKRTINELTEGTTVLLQNGFYATFIRREGENAVVELSEGEEVLVLNQLIARPTPDVKLPHQQIDDLNEWPVLDSDPGLHDDRIGEFPHAEQDDLDRRLNEAAEASDTDPAAHADPTAQAEATPHSDATKPGDSAPDAKPGEGAPGTDEPGDPKADPKKN